MTFTPAMATIPLHSDHHVRVGLEAQLRQCWAMYNALPTEANRYQLVRLERLLQSIWWHDTHQGCYNPARAEGDNCLSKEV